MMCTEKLNLLPDKGGVSKYLIPHAIVIKSDLDLQKRCQVPFLDFVQANQEKDPADTNAPQTIDAIYLRPMSNKQGGHNFINLATVEIIIRNRVWEQPITDLVVKALDKMVT